jgi:hypothetical protein
MPESPAYIPGQPVSKIVPLSRYLPPIPDGVGAEWLRQRLAAGKDGAWVLDPFGASPRLVVEAAQAGYRVLVAANNPVSRFLLEMAANPPAESELRAALAELAGSFKGEQRIEPHLRSLYLTPCAQCGQEVMADAFLWDRGAPAPFGRIYRCPNCGDAGEHPATEVDAARAAHFASGGLHRARALERVAPVDDPDRQHAEEALATYLPRAVYALFTLINKLDNLPVAHRRLLEALLLVACDQANTLWPYPTARSRPRQLAIPPRFRENNIWLALEEAAGQWAAGEENASGSRVPVLIWPEQPPPGGGICIFEGRLRDLIHSLGEIPVGAVLAAIPRPNQAFWTLSALWAGWLWGHEAAAPFKSVLRRRRYDWAWHSAALHAALASLSPYLTQGTLFLGLIGEVEPGFMAAATVAAGLAGFDLEGIALRAESDQAQIHWQRSPIADSAMPAAGVATEMGIDKEPSHQEISTPAFALSMKQIQDLSQEAARAYLNLRGEPASYGHLHAASLLSLAQSKAFSRSPNASPPDVLSLAQNAFQQAFSYRAGFSRYGGSEHSLEIGQWWLKEPGSQVEFPLADRVEMALVRSLQKRGSLTLDELDNAICRAFPGLFTPDLELVSICLESYGEPESPSSPIWRMRAPDAPKARRADLAVMQELLARLGQNLGFITRPAGNPALEGPAHTGLAPLLWYDKDGEIAYAFYLLASAIFGKIVTAPQFPPQKSLIVYPGSRAGLVMLKLHKDPRLNQSVEAGWRFVKFRLLRRLAEDPRLTRDNLDVQLDQDPYNNKDLQMLLL